MIIRPAPPAPPAEPLVPAVPDVPPAPTEYEYVAEGDAIIPSIYAPPPPPWPPYEDVP